MVHAMAIHSLYPATAIHNARLIGTIFIGTSFIFGSYDDPLVRGLL